MADMGWTRQQEEIEKASYRKCIENAKKYGFSEEQANLCDITTNRLCPKCIFDEDGDE